MKAKNLTNNYNSLSIEELTNLAVKMIEDLENQKDLNDSTEKYQKLLKVNHIIKKKFKKGVKNINEKTKENLVKIKSRKNERKIK